MDLDKYREWYKPTLPEWTAKEYAQRVVSQEISAGPHVRNACRRHLRDLERVSDEMFYDPDMEQHVVDFFQHHLKLFHGQFDGLPFLLFPWCRFVIGSLFGWYRTTESGDVVRRFDRAFVETGKGSGKSPLAMGIGLYMLTSDGEAQAEVYVFARNTAQARVPFNMAFHLARGLRNLPYPLRVYGGSDPHTIVYRDSRMERLASGADGSGKSGFVPHCIIADEVHEHRSGAMLSRLEAGIKSRRQPLIFLITNSGSGVEDHCWERHRYAIDVAAGVKEDDRFFSYVCALDSQDRPFEDRKCWAKVNPALPWVPGEGYLAGEVRAAAGLPSKRAEVERLNFCIWTDSQEAWIDRDVWMEAETDALSPLEERRGRPCYLALDLAQKNDLTAGAAVWSMEDGSLELEVTPWVPDAELDRLDSLLPEPVREWVRMGHLRTVGAVQDFSQVADWVAEMLNVHDVRGLAYDRRFIEQLIYHLEARGLPVAKAPGCVVGRVPPGVVPILDHPQGTQTPSTAEGALQLSMHISIEALEGRLLRRTLRAKRNPLLRSGILGAAVNKDSTARRYFQKSRSKVKIDAAVAAAMAVGLADAWAEEDARNPVSGFLESAASFYHEGTLSDRAGW